MNYSDEPLMVNLVELSRIAGIVSTYCDRSEHNETCDPADVLRAADRLRRLAVFMAESVGCDLQDRYASRLAHVEGLSTYEVTIPSPPTLIRSARTWRDLQVAQLTHDRHFHPDVFGLSRREQLIHIALHIGKLCGALGGLFRAPSGDCDRFYNSRLPDMLLFGIKLSTVLGERLKDLPIAGMSPALPGRDPTARRTP